MAAITMQANHSAKQDVIRQELMSGRKEENTKKQTQKRLIISVATHCE
jgi:hypothetical protein